MNKQTSSNSNSNNKQKQKEKNNKVGWENSRQLCKPEFA